MAKLTTLEPGDILSSPNGRSVIEVESEEDGRVLFTMRAPGDTIHRFACQAHELIGWTSCSGMAGPPAPKGKREASEDLAVVMPADLSAEDVEARLSAHFTSGWSFVALLGGPSGDVVILRRRVWR